MTAGYAGEAGRYLDAAVGSVKPGPRPEDDPVRQVLALAGIGQALLALRDTVDERLADVADAVTDAGSQVSEAAGPSGAVAARGRWWRRRRVPAGKAGQAEAARAGLLRMIDPKAFEPGAVVLSSAEADVAWQALADAAAWHAEHGGCAHCAAAGQQAVHERHEAATVAYAALRLRLGGDHR